MRVARALLIALLVAGCGGGAATTGPAPTSSGGQQTASSGGQQTAGPGGGAGVLAAAQAASAHPCTLMPMALVATIVPSPPPVTEALFPPTCSVFGEKVAIAYTISIAPFEIPAGSQVISGLSQPAYLEKLAPGNWTLWVPLTPETGSLFVEVNNQDGKDHQQEVVDLAKAVMQQLGG